MLVVYTYFIIPHRFIKCLARVILVVIVPLLVAARAEGCSMCDAGGLWRRRLPSAHRCQMKLNWPLDIEFDTLGGLYVISNDLYLYYMGGSIPGFE